MSDILDEMTKEELLYWIRSSAYFCIKPPLKSEIMSTRWWIKSQNIQRKREEHSIKLQEIDLKSRDELARQFNSETDLKIKMAILEKMKPYENKLKKWFEENEKINNEEKLIDEYYESIDKQREIERAKK